MVVVAYLMGFRVMLRGTDCIEALLQRLLPGRSGGSSPVSRAFEKQ